MGNEIDSNGNFYEGQYLGGKKHGKGRLTCMNRFQYTGEFYNGYRHGKGHAIYPENNAQYEGEFRWNKKHGYGKYEKVEERSNGKPGNFRYVYHGFWKNDVKWGFGIEINETNDIHGSEVIYEGMFVNSFYHGVGRQIFNDQSYFYGNWRNGKKYGKMVTYDNN